MLQRVVCLLTHFALMPLNTYSDSIPAQLKVRARAQVDARFLRLAAPRFVG
jgi:hypothetical protein